MKKAILILALKGLLIVIAIVTLSQKNGEPINLIKLKKIF